MNLLGLCISICAIAGTVTDAARILVAVPFPSISHQVVFRPLTQELARRGHEVVVITTDPAFPKGQTPANLTEIDVHDLSYDIFRSKFMKISRGVKSDYLGQMELTFIINTEVVDQQFSHPEVQELIHGEKSFDLLIIEALVRPALGLSHVFKAPVILASSLGPVIDNLNAIGAPTHPMLFPCAQRHRLNNITFWEKIVEIYNHFSMVRILQASEEQENQMLRKHFGKDVPSITELLNNVDMLFLNIHPIFEGNHPVPPGVVYMWGIHSKQRKELPQDLKTFLDNSKQGVIYMSFGTNTDPTLLPAELIQKFVRVFCSLPYNVLWKWNNDDLPGRCENIRISKWFPQSDILWHPNVKLFVTQGGLQSTDEAITSGVPLVGIPMLGDQWYNVEKYVHLKIGVGLDVEVLTEEDFRRAVTTVINDESYRQNIKKLKTLMRDEPMPPLERTIWWIEHVLRHGGAKHLRSPAANISWAQYLELEFVFTLLSGLFIITTLVVTVLYYLLRFIVSTCFKNDKVKRS